MPKNFNTLLHTIQHYKLIPPDSTVIVAVSGGSDSLALCHWLVAHQTLLAIKLHIATLNHGARAEAAEDVAFVQQFAETLNVPCTAAYIDVPAIASEQNVGFEIAARRARYQFLAETAQIVDASHVATAHHANDQSETILMHLLRGAGTQGLMGMRLISDMPYHPDLTLVRPLLQIRRAEIEAYCLEHKLAPRIDQTNFDTQYFRNEIRHEILPRLRQINPQIDRALTRIAEITGTEQDFIAQAYQENFRTQAKFADRVSLSLEEFHNWHPAMQHRFILDALAHLDVEPTFEHIQHAIEIAMKGQVGAIAEFSDDARLRLGYNTLYLEPASLPLPTEDYVQIYQSYELKVPGDTVIGEWMVTVSREAMPNFDACLLIPEGESVALRTRQAGDRFQPQGMRGHSQKIKNWLIDNKIPSFLRDHLPLVIIGNIIAAIMLPQGWRIAEKFAQNETSQYNFYFKVAKL